MISKGSKEFLRVCVGCVNGFSEFLRVCRRFVRVRRSSQWTFYKVSGKALQRVAYLVSFESCVKTRQPFAVVFQTFEIYKLYIVVLFFQQDDDWENWD